ncbi:MAG: DNA-3-methyladenine glycosylase 2 family protein [Myxococcales bacterium]|nr:DNA-3-methyladenine glycosylase 2 family protein [Myxococcales bacterium]
MSRTALLHLKRSDPVLARVIAEVGPCRFRARSEGTHFDAIVRAIIYQQLSGKAAATIHARFDGLHGGPPTPAQVLATSDEKLRAVGLSRQKLGYLKDLAERALSSEVAIDRLQDLDDTAVIAALTRVKGIGLWTAQMFLLFRLGRPDVLPDGDLGIRKAVKRAYQLRTLPEPARVLAIGAKWRPYASIAAWYLWRSLDGDGEA